MKMKRVDIESYSPNSGRWPKKMVKFLASSAVGMSLALVCLSTVTTTSVQAEPKQNQELRVERAVCKHCGLSKRLGVDGDFGIKERTSGGVRWDSTCLSCKKAKQAARRSQNKAHSKAVVQSASEKKQNGSNKFTKKSMEVREVSSDQLDFGLWERLYDRPLSDNDRVEIQTNLLAFATVLGSARHFEQGDYIELSKSE